ncbi:hypothetical protein HQ571_03415 [Candidatus Kuenenbacteria bacterium]|nr:hypothetical protein [Candidatus Kuenenbacteria bacterium]
MKKVFIFTILISSLVIFTGCESGSVVTETDFTEDEVMDIIEEVDGDGKIQGSCGAYAKSTCIDYIGSFWTEDQMKLNCSGPDATFSKNTCKYSDFGGCNVGAGTFTEIVTWSYKEGSAGYNEENIVYAAGACNALPMAKWIVPEDLLPNN